MFAIGASPASLAPAGGLRVVAAGGERAEGGDRCGPRDGRGRFGTRAVRRRAGLARVVGRGPAIRMTLAAGAGLAGTGLAGSVAPAAFRARGARLAGRTAPASPTVRRSAPRARRRARRP